MAGPPDPRLPEARSGGPAGARRSRAAGPPQVALSAVLFGGASPAFRPAHSLDLAQVGVDLPYCHELVEASAEVLTTTGSSRLSTATGRCPLDPTVRIGTGLGHSFAIAPWELRWSYAALDERRHESALSLGLTLEAGWRALGASLSASRTMVLGDLALRPGLGVAFSHATRDVDFSVPTSMQAEPEYESPTFTADEQADAESGSALETRFSSNDILVPLGVDLPVRVAENLALVPFVGATVIVPLLKRVRTDSCDNCLLGLDGYALGAGVQLWAGLRIEPWMEPRRLVGRKPAPAPADSEAAAPAPAAPAESPEPPPPPAPELPR